MSINPAISPRVLRSSRLLLCLVLLSSLGATFVHCQEPDPDGEFLLEHGPTLYRGADFLEPNVLPFWYGEYARVAGDEAASSVISVYYFDTPLQEAASWPVTACDSVVMRSNGQRFHYIESQEWSIVVTIQARFPGEVSIAGAFPDPSRALPVVSSLVCSFAAEFAEQHRRFQAVQGDRVNTQVRPPAFPAVLRIAGSGP